MQRIEGGICAVPGVRASGVRQGKYGLALIAASGVAAGMFTTNRVRAAPLDVTAEHLAGGHLDGVIAAVAAPMLIPASVGWRTQGPCPDF
jgi:glutamate N-acetyltransferase/amino-acid N-acetyltransferase